MAMTTRERRVSNVPVLYMRCVLFAVFVLVAGCVY